MTGIYLQPTLTGTMITLRPLLAEDFDALYEAASDPVIWAMHPDSLRYERDIFEQRFFNGAISSGGALAVIDNNTARMIGSSRYYDWNPGLREIAIGFTFLEQACWGKGVNTEMKALMLNHIFTYADSVWFHVAAENLRSIRAVEKLGATYSHKEGRAVEDKPFVQLYYKLTQPAYRAVCGLEKFK